MNKNYKAFGLVMAANVEAIVLFIVAQWVGTWLNQNYPRDSDWHQISYLMAVLILGVSWYRMFRFLALQYKKDQEEGESNE